ncbi:MAG TPA: SDR family NAD(P)-dependent oxidoreductase [Candidatus Limnocylindrales bacterium]|nr:SDR family NAD(P)-dependent oxidoreductase [Candidatus Limnocylindrales bacterium]
MQGRTAVITGATSGIGLIAAKNLAAMGARIILVARDRQRAQATLDALRQAGPAADHRAYFADLSLLADMKRVASEIAAAEPRIHVLLNNAGAMFRDRQLTLERLEKTFALNHMSYFVLTFLLRDKLAAAGAARVINVSSHAHKGNSLNFTDLQSERSYAGFRSYGRSKLCNVLFTSELARRWAATGITANSLHPGFVNTRFGGEAGGRKFRLAKRLFALSPQKGAETMTYLASSQDPFVTNANGLYFYRKKPVPPSREAQDRQSAETLWRMSEQIAGFADPAHGHIANSHMDVTASPSFAD